MTASYATGTRVRIVSSHSAVAEIDAICTIVEVDERTYRLAVDGWPTEMTQHVRHDDVEPVMLVVPADEAASIKGLQLDPYKLPEITETGVVCGDCTKTARDAGWVVFPEQVRHFSVAHVRFCHTRRAEWAAEEASEQAAERVAERYFEERGGSDYDPAERDLTYYHQY